MRAEIKTFVMTCAVICAVPLGALANEAARVTTAFDGWLERHDARGALAIYRKGKAVSVTGHGMDADAPVELASLSKAITAVCAAELVRAGVMDWDDPFDEVTGKGPKITLAQLITQSGGLAKDSTQQVMRRSFGKPKADAAEQVLARVTARDAPKGEAGAHAYTNENYALAGLMIEAATGRSYDEECHARAIVPAGVQAKLSPDVGAFASWGGWQMSVGDHAKWHNHWFASNAALAAKPLKFPNAPVQGGAIRYGIGSYFRVLERGNTFWHFGALCFPGRMSAGSYVVSLFGEWTLVAAYDACVDWDAMFGLDRALVGALFEAQK